MAEDTPRDDQHTETQQPEAAGAHSHAAQQSPSEAPVPDYIAAALDELQDEGAAPAAPAATPAPAAPAAPAATPAPAAPAAPQSTGSFTPVVSPAASASFSVPPSAVEPVVDAAPIPEVNTYETFAVPDAPSTPQVDAIGQTGEFEPVLTQTATSVETGAPRPIGVDPSSTGAFSTIAAGEGAVITNRDTASAAKDAALHSQPEGASSKRSKRTHDANSAAVSSSRATRGVDKQGRSPIMIAAIVIVAVFIIAGALFAYNTATKKSEEPKDEQPTNEILVKPSEKIDFGGYTYNLQQDQNGAWVVARSQQNATSGGAPIVSLQGEPIAFVLCDGALFIPENLDGSWDVIAYMLADGSEPIQLVTADGNVLGGQGALVDAKLNDTTLTLTDSAGKTFTAILH